MEVSVRKSRKILRFFRCEFYEVEEIVIKSNTRKIRKKRKNCFIKIETKDN